MGKNSRERVGCQARSLQELRNQYESKFGEEPITCQPLLD